MNSQNTSIVSAFSVIQVIRIHMIVMNYHTVIGRPETHHLEYIYIYISFYILTINIDYTCLYVICCLFLITMHTLLCSRLSGRSRIGGSKYNFSAMLLVKM